MALLNLAGNEGQAHRGAELELSIEGCLGPAGMGARQVL